MCIFRSIFFYLLNFTIFAANTILAQDISGKKLKDELRNDFLIGAAISTAQIEGKFPEKDKIVKKHFNTIVAENAMKTDTIHPKENEFNFELADKFVKFGMQNKMFIVGHTLIWHSQLPEWFCTDKNGKNVSPEILKKRMKNHIQKIVGRYKGKVKGWDVVNEAIKDDGTFRKSKFYEILGEEFIELAFKYAHEADPKAELYYNDYGMSNERRRDAVVKLIAKLKSKGIRIDAVGMQSHMNMNYPNINEFEKSIVAFSNAGVKVMISEWDMSVLPRVRGASANISDTQEFNEKYNPYTKGLPKEVSEEWNKRMEKFFRLFLKHSKNIKRVTFWGISDDGSWLNYFPINGRTDYGLPFDRSLKPKPFIQKILSGEIKNSASTN